MDWPTALVIIAGLIAPASVIIAITRASYRRATRDDSDS